MQAHETGDMHGGGYAAGHPTKSAGSQVSLASISGSVSGSFFHTPEESTLVCQYPLNTGLWHVELQEDFLKVCVARQEILFARQSIHNAQHGHEAPFLFTGSAIRQWSVAVTSAVALY